jgi:glycosyltransferase involved in cell wall biosynthesis
MAAASVYIVPLRLGVGIRGKILEAWGMALPVVATRVACAGLRYSDGKNIMVADSADEFAARVVMLLQDPVLRVRMGREGRRVAEQFYGWDAIADQLMVLYEDYLNIPKGHRAGSRG